MWNLHGSLTYTLTLTSSDLEKLSTDTIESGDNLFHSIDEE